MGFGRSRIGLTNERFASLNGQGTTRQVTLEGVGFGEPGVQFPVGWPTPTNKVGLCAYRGIVSVTNIVIKDWNGNVLFSDDFSSYADDTFPNAVWKQLGIGANWLVKSDPTAPSLSKKVLRQCDDVLDWQWVYILADVIPANKRFIIEFDMASSGFAGLGGAVWYIDDNQAGVGGYYIFEETSSANTFFRRLSPGGSPVDVLLGTRHTARIAGKWYRVRAVVDDCNVKWFSDNDEGQLIPRFHAICSGSAVILDTALETDTLGPGTLEGLWFAQNGFYTDPTLRVYKDDMNTPAFSVPLREFLFAGQLPNSPYFTRLQGTDYPGRSHWRRLHVPFEQRLRLEVDNNQIGGMVVFAQTWWRMGSAPHAYKDYRLIRKSETIPPYGWMEIVNIGGEGVLNSIYVQESNSDVTLLEGNLRITVDGEIVWVSSGTEDVPLCSYYFQSFQRSDYVGIVAKTEVSPLSVAWYRYFIPDPIIFKESLKVELQCGQERQSTIGTNSDVISLAEVYLRAS
jgi:hypothetical protein